MLVEFVLYLGGVVALVVGANRAVIAAEDVTLYYGVTPFFVGVTLITSAPRSRR